MTATEFGIKRQVTMLANFERPLMYIVGDSDLIYIQKIINNAPSLLWVTVGGLLEGKQPEFAMGSAMRSGLARTITSEQPSLDFWAIDVDFENVTLDQARQSDNTDSRRHSSFA